MEVSIFCKREVASNIRVQNLLYSKTTHQLALTSFSSMWHTNTQMEKTFLENKREKKKISMQGMGETKKRSFHCWFLYF